MTLDILNTIGIINIAWLLVLTVFVVRMILHYNRLTKGVTRPVLKEVLDELLSDRKKLNKRVDDLERLEKELKEDGATHIQRVGILRFNPFSDTGGSQSFILALLDNEDNGIVITSLYARTGNRWYVKKVIDGKGSELELSKEERKAINNAQKIKS